eukprot:CAMPEP_0119467720 /NCGR_PEP_ID=MMETSP1344-20130328/1777_1 /TAXON_ID=236787 /ORGANISM="Florenciella parvula, Strain CCMP2471" /LENGTH=30 /DNA_ID= /DNA_START= /DNA_END= /DNA_ORIENTATION=
MTNSTSNQLAATGLELLPTKSTDKAAILAS